MTDEQALTPDPTEGGRLCGAQRSANQRNLPDDDGHMHCRRPAGWGTENATGRCKLHGGSTPNHVKAARLKLAELVDPAIVTLGRAMTDDDVKVGDRLRAADSVLDRTGYPRTTQIDVEAGRLSLAQRIAELRAESEGVAPGLGDGVRSTESADSTESVESTESTEVTE